MKSSRVPALATGLLLVMASGALAEDAPRLKEGDRVRIHAGSVREIPGVMVIKPESTETKGGAVIVANDDRLVAAKIPGQEEPLCLPRPGRTLIGQFVAMDDETWTITVNGRETPFKVPRYAIARMERSRGPRREAGERALRGGGIGLLGGGLGGAFLGLVTGNDDSFCPTGCSSMVGATVFGGLGFLVGAAVGLASEGERWEQVPTRGVQVSVKPVARGRGLGLAVSF